MNSFDIETVVIGAGVVGLAVARALAVSGRDVVVLEQHGLIGSETSARNSEVIHAGIYYPQGSAKARLCVRGKAMLYEFCKTHGVPYSRIGKLIVAADEEQAETLGEISAHAAANGVNDLQYLDRGETLRMEPALDVAAALHSPSTGIFDSHAYMLALQGELEDHGGSIALNTRVERIERPEGGGFRLYFPGADSDPVTARQVVVSGGLHSALLLQKADWLSDVTIPKMHFAKGNYFRLQGRAPFSHLIYPVPEPGGLGVHLTLDLAGQARFGPDVEWLDQFDNSAKDYEVDPRRSEAFYDAIRAYWPGLSDGALLPDYAGIRPKLSASGEANADFEIIGADRHGYKGLVALMGIESPGLTASLAIAEEVVSALE